MAKYITFLQFQFIIPYFTVLGKSKWSITKLKEVNTIPELDWPFENQQQVLLSQYCPNVVPLLDQHAIQLDPLLPPRPFEIHWICSISYSGHQLLHQGHLLSVQRNALFNKTQSNCILESLSSVMIRYTKFACPSNVNVN